MRHGNATSSSFVQPPVNDKLSISAGGHTRTYSFIPSFIQAISIAPLQVHYYTNLFLYFEQISIKPYFIVIISYTNCTTTSTTIITISFNPWINYYSLGLLQTHQF